jgi:hypothetical protein
MATLAGGSSPTCCVVPAPTFRIIARVPSGNVFAFTAPIAMGWSSWVVPKLTRLWAIPLALGLLALVGGIATFFTPTQRPDCDSTSP